MLVYASFRLTGIGLYHFLFLLLVKMLITPPVSFGFFENGYTGVLCGVSLQFITIITDCYVVTFRQLRF